MIRTLSGKLERFQETVGIKFQLYNSLFLSLPFYGVEKTGILLSLFASRCEEGFAAGNDPVRIVDGFFAERSSDKIDLLFRFVQYVERQVVLFDALEDAAFSALNDVSGPGTLPQLEVSAIQAGKVEALRQALSDFSVRLVLTAHPTQFYPDPVLGIINNLTDAIDANEINEINTLLQQLGRTPFFKKEKPAPFDEAESLIWYLEHVFYDAVGEIASELNARVGGELGIADLVRMGFWSGGDRDGNPFVTVDTTLKVANALRLAALRCYHRDVVRMKARLTFSGVEKLVADLEQVLYRAAYQSEEPRLTKDDIKGRLDEIRNVIVKDHHGLFVETVEDLIGRVEIFGVHFASLDIRQEASEHSMVLTDIARLTEALPGGFAGLDDEAKIEILFAASANIDPDELDDELAQDTIRTIKAFRQIQQINGKEGCHRYIISQCQSALHVAEVCGLFMLSGWTPGSLSVDIVPLFETIEDLKNAPSVMAALYRTPAYREHLERRGNRQTIMLGFSDGTKDGGYLMANWSIYKAKDELTRLSREHGIEVVFFDGRGGPPARGGGKTHRFYSSMGGNIEADSIELTVQGQTVSSNFGTVAAARFNIEQLINAGIHNEILSPRSHTFSEGEEVLMLRLAEHSFAAYKELKEHPQFLDYLSDVSPLRFYAQTNIGSRPAKRGDGKLTLKGLRAIPFVGAWSQIKQNVPGFYGVGSAIKALEDEIDAIAEMYHSNGFFRALIDNCEMAMQKSFFPLTEFLADDPRHGPIWRKIRDEYELTRGYLNRISGTVELMSELPIEQQSVQTRERIVLPLVTIQQYALTRLRDAGLTEEQRTTFEKLVIRCSFGIINAGRNSA